MDLQNSNRLYISQRFTALINRFELLNEADELVGFAEQKRFNLYESVTVWKTEAKDAVLFTITAEKLLDVHGRYFIRDGEGRDIGYLRKNFRASLLRSTWGVYDMSDTLLFEAKEKNLTIAIIRRIASFIPIDFVELLEQLPIRFYFEKAGKLVGHHRRLRGLRDKYEIEVTDDLKDVDRRLLLALGLLLDILQQR
jgi:uncharacterized protein YxjI